MDEDLHDLPEAVTGPVNLTFVDDLPSRTPDDNSEWSIQFDWDGDSPYTTFTIYFESGLGGNEPMPGWASWIDGDLLVAHIDYNGPAQEAVRITGGSPFGEEPSDPRAWLKLARALVRIIMKEVEGSYKGV